MKLPSWLNQKWVRFERRPGFAEDRLPPQFYRTSGSAWVDTAVNLIADSVAEMELQVLRNETRLAKHPIIEGLRSNEDYTREEIYNLLTQWILRRGVAYLLVLKAGAVYEFEPLEPGRVKRLSRTIYSYRRNDGKSTTIQSKNLITIRCPDWQNPSDNLSATGKLSQMSAIDSKAQSHIDRSLKGKMTLDAIARGKKRMTKEAINQLARNFREFQQEDGNMLVLDSDIEISKIGQTFAELTLVDLLKYQKTAILSALRVGSSLLGEDRSLSRAAAEGLLVNYTRFAVRPIIRKIAGGIDRYALKNNLGVEVSFTDPVPADQAALTDRLNKLLDRAITREEARKMLGLQGSPPPNE